MSEIIYGRNAVMEALRANDNIVEVLLAYGLEHQRLAAIKRLAKTQKVPVKVVSKTVLADLAGDSKTQGVLARVGDKDDASLQDIQAQSRARAEPPLIALLDGIEDPHNLGAILRSVDAAGFHGVVLPKKRSAGVTGTVVKTSAGASAHVPIARVANLSNAIKELKRDNIWVVGADQDAPQDFTEADLTGPLAVVVGAEGKGMHRLVRENCDFLVRIPMHGRMNSLNASVAAALLFFEVRRQRSISNRDAKKNR